MDAIDVYGGSELSYERDVGELCNVGECEFCAANNDFLIPRANIKVLSGTDYRYVLSSDVGCVEYR